MLLIGSHVGFNKDTQLLGSTEEAMSYGATTFMFLYWCATKYETK